MKYSLLIFLFFTSTLFSQLKIALLDNSKSNKDEFNSAFNFIKNNKNFSAVKISFEELLSNKLKKDNIPILWIHRVDSTEFNQNEIEEKFLASLKKFVADGGNLFLTIDALKYLNYLGVEKNIPQINYVDAIDDGYGRKLGLHSFLYHPVFHDLFGGAYIFNPIEDMKTYQVGFFNDESLQGKIIAVDWSYITLKEKSKLLLEYNLGKGKILACGAYLFFNINNNNSLQFEKFVNNCFYYLDKRFEHEKKFYWNDFTPDKTQLKFNKISFKNSKNWDTENKIKLINSKGTDNFWNVAGERILVMGKEKTGIDEIWSHPFMAIKNYKIGIKDSDSIFWLENIIPEIEVHPNSFIRKYTHQNFSLKEVITTSENLPTAIVHYEFISNTRKEFVIEFESNLRLMWPYSEYVLGKINVNFNKDLNAFHIYDKRKILNAFVGINKQIKKFEINMVDSVTNKISFIVNINAKSNFDFIISSSNENANLTLNNYINSIQAPEKIYYKSKKYFQNELSKYLSIKTPDKNFNEGFLWSLLGTKKFIVNTPGIGKSIVAGYSTTAKGWNGGHKINGRPGYSWYFGRDGVWSGFALLDIGDYESVKKILQLFNLYQDLNGKIFHELTTSGAVHYDASDSTPLYLILCGRYLKETGDVEFIKQNWEHIKKAIEYCYSTDTDNDKLIENTNVGHGWVEGGGLYTAHTEVYLAACWAEALKYSSSIAKELNYEVESKKFYDDYISVKEIINNNFWNIEKNTLSFSKLKDGSYNSEKTVLSSVPIYFDLIDSTKAKIVLNDFAENYFSSDWGLRILRSDSKIYNPRGYHTGSVWPLFTGWVSLAEYKYQKYSQAFTHVLNNLNIYRNWQLGAIEEVLNGDEFKPAGVCSQQCWSHTMVLQPIIEGMLGIKVDAINKILKLNPVLPPNWKFLEVKNIYVGKKKVDLKLELKQDNCNFAFNSNNNEELEIILKYENEIHNLRLKKNKIVKFGVNKNPKLIPLQFNPKPNDKSKGFRIIEEKFHDNVYEIETQGTPNLTDTLKIYSPFKRIKSVDDAKIINYENSIYKLLVTFENNNTKYINKKLRLFFKESK